MFPNARLIHLCEWYYTATGADIGFAPEFPLQFDDHARIRTWNALVRGDEVSYGRPPPRGEAQKEPAARWREHMLKEVQLDMSRTHFMGRVPKAQFVKVLQVSAAHVYLTYPFVLSWSLLEAMACGAPIVASDTAPVREVIRDGVNGWLVGFFDVEAIAQKVNEVLCTPREQVGVRAGARWEASLFGWNTALVGYEGLAVQ